MKSLAQTPDDLSSRDFEIIRLYVDEGCTHREIAARLHYSRHYIKHFFEPGDPRCIYDKIEGVTNEHQLRDWWISHARYKDAVQVFSPDDMVMLDYRRRIGEAKTISDKLRKEVLLLEQAAHAASDNRLARYVLKRYAELLFVYGFTLDDTTGENQGIKSIKKVAVKLKRIAYQTKDSQVLGLYHILQCFVCYLVKDYIGQQNHAFQALAVGANLPPDVLFIAAGHSIIGSSYLHEEEGIQAGEHALQQLLQREPTLSEIRAVEIPMVSGRARGLAGDHRGIDLLMQGWDISRQTDAHTTHPRELVSLAKATLEVAPLVGITDKTFLERSGQQGLAVAQARDMPRMVQGITGLLSAVLNQ